MKRKKKEISQQHFDVTPSEETKVYWIYAYRKKDHYPRPTENNGKWLIFVDITNIDEVWMKIKNATEEGKLGLASKVATAKHDPSGKEYKEKVICVYTYDWTDEKDVMRIREELRNLGITHKIPYKTDEDTIKGKYRATGYQKISKYFV